MQPLNFFPKGFQSPQGLKPNSSRKEIKKALLQNPEKLAEYILAASNDETWRKEKTNQEFLSKLTSKITQVQLPHALALQILKVAKEVLDLPPNHPLFTTATMHCAREEEIKENKFVLNKFALKALSPVFQSMFERGLSETRSGEVTYADLSKEAASLFKKVVEGEILDFSSVSGETLFELLSFLHRHDPQDKILPKIYKQLESEGQISEKNILGFLHFALSFNPGELTEACFCFLRKTFPHVKFSTELDPLSIALQFIPGIAGEEVAAFVPISDYFTERQACIKWDFSDSAINSDNVSSILQFSHQFKIQKVTKACLKFLKENHPFSHVKFSIELDPFSPEGAYRGTVQFFLGITDEEVVSVLPLLTHLNEKQTENPPLLKAVFLDSKSGFPQRFSIDKNCMFEGICRSDSFDFKNRSFKELCDFIQCDFPLLKTPLTRENLLKLRKSKIPGLQKLLTQSIQKVDNKNVLIELLSLNPEITRDLIFSLSNEPKILFQRISRDKIAVSLAKADQEPSGHFLLEKLELFEELGELLGEIDQQNIHFLLGKPDEKKTFGEFIGEGATPGHAFISHCAPEVLFMKNEGNKIFIDLGKESDENCERLIPLLEILREKVRGELMNVKLVKKSPDQTFIDQLFTPIRHYSRFESWEEPKNITLDLFLNFLKNDLPLLKKPLDVESAKKLATSSSLLIPQIKRRCADLLYTELVGKNPARQAEVVLDYLTIKSFFGKEDLQIWNNYLKPLLQEVQYIDGDGAFSLKPKYAISLIALCPKIKEISLLHCEHFKSTEILELKRVCGKRLNTIRVSAYFPRIIPFELEPSEVQKELNRERTAKNPFFFSTLPWNEAQREEVKQTELELKNQLKGKHGKL